MSIAVDFEKEIKSNLEKGLYRHKDDQSNIIGKLCVAVPTRVIVPKIIVPNMK